MNTYLNENQSALTASMLITLINQKYRFAEDFRKAVTFNNILIVWEREQKSVHTKGAAMLPKHQKIVLDHIVTEHEVYYRRLAKS